MHLSSNRILPILDQLQAEGIHCVQLNFAFDHSVLKVTADICAKARDRGMTIGACTEGLSDTEISVLHTLGIERYFISLETFDETAYRHMHVAGRKADFHFQEMSPKRAVSAGMDVSIGVLLGLSDYHREIASLIGCSVEHSGPGPIGMFFNLLRPTDGAVIQDPPFAISPAELRKIVATLRLCHPRVRLMISTRDQQQSGLWGLADELLLSFRGRWGIGP